MASSSDEEENRSLGATRDQTIRASRRGAAGGRALAIAGNSTRPNHEPRGGGAVHSPQQAGRNGLTSKGMKAEGRVGAAAAAAAAAARGKPVTAMEGQGETSNARGRARHSARCRGEDERTRFESGDSRKGRGGQGGRVGPASACGNKGSGAAAGRLGSGSSTGRGGGSGSGRISNKGRSSPGGDRGRGKGSSMGRGGGSPSGRRSDKGKPSTDGSKKGKQRKAVTGILGVPIHWAVEDCDYDDSEDENYLPNDPSNVPGSASGVDGAFGTRRGARGKGRSCKARRGGDSDGARRREGWITELSREIMLVGVVRAYLCATSKCALQRTCRQMRDLIDSPEAWESLDLRADVIGTRIMKSGRRSIMSRQPLFFLARSVILQPRFARVIAADLRGVNLGAMGSTPDLLVKLFEHCKSLTTLNLWNTFVEHEDMPQPCSAVEKALADNLAGIQHLALEVESSNKGLKLLVEGCPRLKSLHIGSRFNRKFDRVSVYPNDGGMKVFVAPGAPSLETLSLFDKVSVGTAGLKCLLDPASCPQLKTLILTRMDRVNDRCLRSIAPSMGRITSLTLDQCPVNAGTVQFVVEQCPELRSIAVCTYTGIIDKQEEGRPLVEFLLSQQSRQLAAVSIEAVPVAESDQKSLWPGSTGCPLWLRHDAELSSSVLACAMPVFTFCSAVNAGERIRPFMHMA